MTRHYLQLTIVIKLRKNIRDKDRHLEDPNKRLLKMISMQLMSVQKILLMKEKCYKRNGLNLWVVMMMTQVNLVLLKTTKKLTFLILKSEDLKTKKIKQRKKYNQFLVDLPQHSKISQAIKFLPPKMLNQFYKNFQTV